METLSFELTKSSTEITQEFNVAGAPLMPMEPRSGSFEPQTVTVVFVDGELRRLTIAGRRARKGGTLGLTWAENRYYRAADVPAWAQSLTKSPYA